MTRTTVIEDAEIHVIDIRCIDAPRQAGALEVPASDELVVPLGGVFDREVFAHGTHRAGVPSTADPTRIHLFRRAAPSRVSHPLAGGDRSIAVVVHDGLPVRRTFPDDIPAPPIAQTFARRLASAVAHRTVDDLAAGEAARSLIDACLGWFRSSARATNRHHATARQIRIEIAGDLSERLPLPELGRRVGVSGWEAARRFRRATGTSIHRYRTALRVQAALERIEQGERDLTLLALDLGFAHHSHLTNVLRAHAGGPPSAYRRVPTPRELAALRTVLQA